MDSRDRSWSDSNGNALRSKLPDILTVDEAASLLRVNRKTLYEVIRLNRPRWAIRFGRTIRVSRAALLEAFRGNRGAALGDNL
jgi:excisionase family DNA binding protein